MIIPLFTGELKPQSDRLPHDQILEAYAASRAADCCELWSCMHLRGIYSGLSSALCSSSSPATRSPLPSISLLRALTRQRFPAIATNTRRISTKMSKTAAVFTATGEQGSSVVDSLLKAGYKVTGFSRDTTSSKSKGELGG